MNLVPKKHSTKKKKSDNEKSNIDGSIIGETEKALLINFKTGQELWIPKSTIHGQYNSNRNISQNFSIDNWILKRNKILS